MSASRDGGKDWCALLVGLCLEQGVIEPDAAELSPDADLIESGVVDSMGLYSLRSLIKDRYGVEIPEALFIGELRTLRQIAAFLQLRAQTGGPQ